MSNSLDPDQARRFVGPDLGPNCLPKLPADDTGRQRVKYVLLFLNDYYLLLCSRHFLMMGCLPTSMCSGRFV